MLCCIPLSQFSSSGEREDANLELVTIGGIPASQRPVDVFVGFLSSVRSMLCADIQKQTERGHMKRVKRLDRFASIPAVCHRKHMFRFISTPWAIYRRRLKRVLAAMSIAPPIASFLSMCS